jgi:hypothetical protein
MCDSLVNSDHIINVGLSRLSFAPSYFYAVLSKGDEKKKAYLCQSNEMPGSPFSASASACKQMFGEPTIC